MKNLKNLLILFSFGVAMISCKDDDSAPAHRDVTFGLSDKGEMIAVPMGLMNSTDPNADEVSFYIAQMNIAAYTGFFNIPAGAVKYDGSIVASNARINGTVSTYVWTHDQMSIAYQITERETSYFLELFTKFDQENWYKWFEGEQSKDGKSGSFIILDNYSSVRSVVAEYHYELQADGSLYLEYLSNHFEEKVIAVLQADHSGTLKSYIGDQLNYEYTWDAAGNGTWTQYDSGSVLHEGVWTAQ